MQKPQVELKSKVVSKMEVESNGISDERSHEGVKNYYISKIEELQVCAAVIITYFRMNFS